MLCPWAGQFPLSHRPPKTYIQSPIAVAEWKSLYAGGSPLQCSNAQCIVFKSSLQGVKHYKHSWINQVRNLSKILKFYWHTKTIYLIYLYTSWPNLKFVSSYPPNIYIESLITQDECPSRAAGTSPVTSGRLHL